MTDVVDQIEIAGTATSDPRHLQYDWLRQQCPVYADPPSKSLFVTRHADVCEVLQGGHFRDPDRAEPGTFVSTMKVETPEWPEDEHWRIGFLDDPDHVRVRAPIARALHLRAVAAKPFIERSVDERLEKLAGRTSLELVSDYAMPIPLEAIAYILGIQGEDLVCLRRLSEGLWKVWKADRTPFENSLMIDSHRQFAQLVDRAMTERRAAPREDLISDLVRYQQKGGPLSDSQIRANVTELLVGGHITTADLISSTTLLLLSHPDERRKLDDDPSLIGAAIEEALRLEPPVESVHRIAAYDLQIAERPICPGEVMTLSLTAANRDPKAFADPHRFDISREGAQHVSFGGGGHICVGLALARLEAGLAVSRLLQRFPALRLAEPEAPPAWKAVPHFRGLERLDLRT